MHLISFIISDMAQLTKTSFTEQQNGKQHNITTSYLQYTYRYTILASWYNQKKKIYISLTDTYMNQHHTNITRRAGQDSFGRV
jgi:hypothetical protein